MHVHVESADGEAKFWLEPMVSLAGYERLTKSDLYEIEKIIRIKKNEITKAWHRHLGR